MVFVDFYVLIEREYMSTMGHLTESPTYNQKHRNSYCIPLLIQLHINIQLPVVTFMLDT